MIQSTRRALAAILLFSVLAACSTPGYIRIGVDVFGLKAGVEIGWGSLEEDPANKTTEENMTAYKKMEDKMKENQDKIDEELNKGKPDFDLVQHLNDFNAFLIRVKGDLHPYTRGDNG